MVYSFYFLCFGSRRNEYNRLWGIRGRGQKSTACSEDIFVMEFYLSALTLHLQWSILFIFCVLAPEGMNAIVFGEEMGEKSEYYWLLGRYLVQKKKMIYCDNIMINSSCVVIELAVSFYYQWQHRGDSIRISHDLLTSPPYPSQRLLDSFLLEPTSRKKKYCHIPDAASERV